MQQHKITRHINKKKGNSTNNQQQSDQKPNETKHLIIFIFIECGGQK
jgi:hypothetical protein